MGMVLNTNKAALQAQRSLEESRVEMEKAMERLSTGKRINSAADDAAGLAMVERMNAQIAGLKMATKNANDGVALVKTVETALVEVSGMLQRMRVLSVQASNDTNTASERGFAKQEINTLQAEVSRVSANTRYNGALVLNGTFSARSLQLGTMAGEELIFSVDTVEAAKLGAYVISSNTTPAIAVATHAAASNPTVNAQDITITAKDVTKSIDVQDDWSAKTTATKISALAGSTGVTASARTNAHLYTTQTTDQTFTIKINGTATGSFTISKNDVSTAVSEINKIASTTSVNAKAVIYTDSSNNTTHRVLLTDSDGDDFSVENTAATATMALDTVSYDGETVSGGTVVTLAASGSAGDTAHIVGTIRATSNNQFTIAQAADGSATEYFAASTTATLSTISDVDVTTAIKAANSLAYIDGALEHVSNIRSSLGALQNRLNYTVSNLMKVTQFTTAARSRIEDADFAEETSRLAKAQVLQQAGAAMLSQANASTDVVLQLLRG